MSNSSSADANLSLLGDPLLVVRSRMCAGPRLGPRRVSTVGPGPDPGPNLQVARLFSATTRCLVRPYVLAAAHQLSQPGSTLALCPALLPPVCAKQFMSLCSVQDTVKKW